MISYPITLDGQTYPHIHVVNLKRRFVVTDTDLTERVQNGEIDRDVLGTFYNYSAVIDSDDAFPAEYGGTDPVRRRFFCRRDRSGPADVFGGQDQRKTSV